jgi:hypothetical protein
MQLVNKKQTQDPKHAHPQKGGRDNSSNSLHIELNRFLPGRPTSKLRN